MFSVRGKFKSNGLLKGLDFSKDPEQIDDEGLSLCDGFIEYEGVLKKDHKITLCSDIADNIVYYAGGELPICTSIDPLPPWDGGLPPWDGGLPYEVGTSSTAPVPSAEIAEYDWDELDGDGDPVHPEDPRWYLLSWKTGSMTSMNPGSVGYLTAEYYYGIPKWYLTVTGTGSVTHTKVEEGMSKYETSADFSGSFYVEVCDIFRCITKTISVGSKFGLHITSGGTAYWAIYNEDLVFQGVYPYASYSIKTRVYETVFYLHSLLQIGPPLTNTYWIEKNGVTYLGPYINNIDENTGSSIYSHLNMYVNGEPFPPGILYYYAASLGDYNILGYYIYNHTSNTYSTYIDINGSITTLGTDLVPDTDCVHATVGYKTSNYLSVITYTSEASDQSGKMCVLRIMNLAGEVTSLDLTSSYSFSTNSLISIEGTTYDLQGFYQVI